MPSATSEKLFLTIGTLPNAVARADAQIADPQRPADDVVERERRVAHRAGARHERHERADDRHEAAEHDRLAAVLFEEGVGSIEVLAG